MELIHTVHDLAKLSSIRPGQRLVLVPTMGALHDGHLSLVEIGRRYGPVVVSIFVNPQQFGAGEDFETYPQDLEQDLAALDPLGVAAVFAPAVHEMYGTAAGVRIEPGRRGEPLCGACRPGHFAGVLTVVAKLLNLVRPDVAVFGRKDAQQCLVIDAMVRDLDFPVRLIDGPTLREPDGLAMSSRNRYLSPDDRQRARCLWGGLSATRALIANGERDVQMLQAELGRQLNEADSVEYAEIRAVPELTEIDTVGGTIVLAVAVQVGPARLIDNLVLDVAGDTVQETNLLTGKGQV
ncbi:MAG: pantoate--beta-alanine ligase [bacterium]